jgi:hypothetical protein
MLNPLLIKEFRIETRGWETYAVGTVYILALSALTFSLIWDASTGERVLDPEYGREMFLAFVVVLILAICLICPAFAVGAISSERERLTFDQLRVTLLKPRQILVGKASLPLIYILILLFASLPVAVLIMPAGGISLMEVVFCYLIAFVSAAAFSLIGLMWSSIYRSTRVSTAMTYAIMGFFTFGTAVVPMILSGVLQVKLNRVLLDLCIALNPFHAVFSVLGKGRQFRLAGLSSWEIAMAGYLIISVIAICVALLRFKRMRS